jgi:hypothetical protein
LEDWSLVNFQVGKRGPFLFGTICGHDVERDGKPGMCTSRLILFRLDLGYAVTKNSIYVLGKKNRCFEIRGSDGVWRIGVRATELLPRSCGHHDADLVYLRAYRQPCCMTAPVATEP